MWNVIGFYKKESRNINLTLAERDGMFYVVSKEGQERKIVCKGDEEYCTKMFIMLASGFIDADSKQKTEL